MPTPARGRPRREADDPVERTLRRILVEDAGCEQPPLAALPDEELTAVLPALALGGAERIVLDWAARARRRHRVHLVALGRAAAEYAVPAGVRVTRIEGDVTAGLAGLGARLAASANPVCLCHLLTPAQRGVLRRSGAVPVPVIHNARAGWIDDAAALAREPRVIAVSEACARDLRAAGVRGRIEVIRHLPAPRPLSASLRGRFREAWRIPASAFVVGMIGGVKPQKAYPRALRVLAALRSRLRDARLVIVGGPVGRDGAIAWEALAAQRARLGLGRAVVLAGFVPDAVRCLPAFDIVLSTSRHEGLSIATLEALANGLPVVASAVGGQGEVAHDALRLLPLETEDAAWAEALEAAASAPRSVPAWAGFPAYRQWTLAHLAAPYPPGSHALFVTANLNAGGAQRSLVNLAVELAGRAPLSIAVTGSSTSGAFHRELRTAGVEVVRSAASRDAFDHAEAVVRIARSRRAALVVLWSVDAKIKLLLAKALPSARLVDVSPGAYADEELAATATFQRLVAYGADDYYRRLDRLVLKHSGTAPAGARTTVIPNGVRSPRAVKTRYALAGTPRVVMSARLAPSKFVAEALAAMAIVRRRLPHAELHVFGGAEPRHADFAAELVARAGAELDRSVFFHGPDAGVRSRLASFDAALVLGRHQGCPNACLEALAAGVPVVANDSGGTREQIVPRKTGWLVADTDPATIAGALLEALTDPAEARRRAAAGRKRVARRFSMPRMARSYLRLLGALNGESAG
jgi:glycosyltransferase involved in cell wall biosynthesis